MNSYELSVDITGEDVALLMHCANEVADGMKELILDLWEKGTLNESFKEDRTPVTEVDLKAEELARKIISKRYPEHGILGEEYPSVNPGSNYQWTIDPIDGTQNLVNRIPTFGSLVGLRYRGQAVYGIIDHPVLDIRIRGGFSLGAFLNDKVIRLNDIKQELLGDNDIIATNSPAVFGVSEEGRELFDKIISFHPHSRIYYDCYDHTLAILGSLAVVLEPNLNIWDITPIEALMNEVGGVCRRFNERGSGEEMLVNAVFGKSKAVNLLSEYLGLQA
jgi:histidinol-phosphatase